MTSSSSTRESASMQGFARGEQVSMISSFLNRVGGPNIETLKRYAASTSYMGLSLVAHAVGLVILARALGAEQYGTLTLITTASNLALVWCGLGSGEVLRRIVSRDTSAYPQALGHALTLLLSTGLVLTVATSLITASMVHVTPDYWSNLLLISLLVVSNTVLFGWSGLAEQILLAHDRFNEANIVNLSSGVGRALAVGVACLAFGVNTLQTYVFWHVAFYSIVALVCLWFVAPLGRPRGFLLRDELARGSTISVANLMIVLRKNADVLMLGAIASPAVVGIYAVASRIVATASVVTASLDRLVYSNLARAGQLGAQATFALAKRYAGYATVLCAVTTAAVWIAAPFVPWVFGSAYVDSVPLVKILAGTLILTSLQWLAVDSLTAAERHGERLVVEVVTGLIGVAILVGLGFTYGLNGVLWSVYLSGIIAVIGLWLLLWNSARLHSPPQKSEPDVPIQAVPQNEPTPSFEPAATAVPPYGGEQAPGPGRGNTNDR